MSILKRDDKKEVNYTGCPENFHDLPPYNLEENSRICYHVEQHKVDWDRANDECEEQGGTLASVETKGEWEHLERHWYLEGGNGWIGNKIKCAVNVKWDFDGAKVIEKGLNIIGPIRENRNETYDWIVRNVTDQDVESWSRANGIFLGRPWWFDQPEKSCEEHPGEELCVRVAADNRNSDFGWWAQKCHKPQPYLCTIQVTPAEESKAITYKLHGYDQLMIFLVDLIIIIYQI